MAKQKRTSYKLWTIILDIVHTYRMFKRRVILVLKIAEKPLMDNRDFFIDHVELLRTSPLSKHAYNHYPWQARVVAWNIVQFAQENNYPIDIFSSDFDIYNSEVANGLVKILQRGHKVRITLADKPDDLNKKAIDALIEKAGDSGDLLEIKHFTKYNRRLRHAWLAGTAYRFEKTHRRAKGKVSDYHPDFPARFAFHEPEEAEKVRKYLVEEVYSKTEELLNYK